MKWLEPLVVRLAGQAHLESTIPLIVAKLLEDGGDLLNEECAEALTRIGTPAVLHAVAEAFPTAEQHFRIYATNPLEHIHSDLAVETCLKLLPQEEDEVIRRELVNSLLYQFAPEGIGIARQMLVGRELDFDGKGLRNCLLETCTLMGERFPEYDEWLAIEKAEKAEHWKRVRELEGDPAGLMLFALEKLTGMGYLIGEKFLNFLEGAETDDEWRQAIPAFVTEIKAIFEPLQIAEFLNTPRRLGVLGHVATEEAHRKFRDELDEGQRIREDARNLTMLEWAKELLLHEVQQ
jgi:hypothetical protein